MSEAREMRKASRRNARRRYRLTVNGRSRGVHDLTPEGRVALEDAVRGERGLRSFVLTPVRSGQ